MDVDWNKYIIYLALLSGIGSGVAGLSADTADRFKGADFNREIFIRDKRIDRLEDALQSHLEHSARYSQMIDDMRAEMQRSNGD